MDEIKYNKKGGFNTLDDASKQLGGLGAKTIGEIADHGTEPEPKEARQWDKDRKSVLNITDAMTPGTNQSKFIPNEKAKAMREFGIDDWTERYEKAQNEPIDLKNLNAEYENRDDAKWTAHKPLVQKLTNEIRKNAKDKYGIDLLSVGLSGKPTERIGAVNHMTAELAKKLGDKYDPEDIAEYVRQYFNLNKEQYEKLADKAYGGRTITAATPDPNDFEDYNG